MNDPYTDMSIAVDRLYKEYKQHPRLIVALDFDDTIFDFHKSGSNYPRVIDVVQRCQALGFYIVLFTGTVQERWEDQILYAQKMGIKIDSVNKNPIPLPFGNHGKIYYNILLDDRAGLGQAVETLENLLRRIELKEIYKTSMVG